MQVTIGDRVRDRYSTTPGGIRATTGTVVGTIAGQGMAAVAVRRDLDESVSVHYLVNGAEPDIVKIDEP